MGIGPLFRRDLLEAITAYAATEEAADLDGPERRLLETTGSATSDGRATNWPPTNGTNCSACRPASSNSRCAFGKNLDDWEDDLDLTRDDLDGLPDDYVDRLRPGVDAEDTFRVSMEYPDYMPFMQQAQPQRPPRGASSTSSGTGPPRATQPLARRGR